MQNPRFVDAEAWAMPSERYLITQASSTFSLENVPPGNMMYRNCLTLLARPRIVASLRRPVLLRCVSNSRHSASMPGSSG